jgi:uncharacterized protein YutE (UPF0331/DUF86 family)
MGRGEGARGPGSGNPRSGRRDRGRKRILDITSMVPLQHRGLRHALEPFGGAEHFDADAYLAARTSEELDQFDRTALAERYWSVLQNLLRDLADIGLAEARRLGVHEVRRAGKTFDGLADLGVLTRSDALRLTEMQAIRNDDQHLYPAEVRRLAQAMRDLNSIVPRFMASYGAWFESWPPMP